MAGRDDRRTGKRSWRYSYYHDPNAKRPPQVAILTREGCSFCARAKKLLNEAGDDYAEIPLPHTSRSKTLGAIAKPETVP